MHIRYSPGRDSKFKQQSGVYSTLESWTLIYVANFKNMKKLQIFGGSKLVVDGGCDCISIFVPFLEHILQNIKDKMSLLERFTCKLNMKADQPSKEAVKCQPGSLDIYEFVDGHETLAMDSQILEA